MDYDLDRLGPTEFEHMVQALAIAELGISVTTFGAGADGGREATFEGKVVADSDSSLTVWDGYGVIQAKTIRFAGNPAKNADSIASSVTAELNKFVLRDGFNPRTPAPKYYIVATNARLSPVPETGGVDKVREALTQHEIGLAGSAIWHYEHICRLLDRHPGIRKTYAGFLISGDILGKLMEMLDGSAAHMGDTLKAHAAAQVAARQALKLETAGVSDANKVALSEVAIDLPALDTEGNSQQVVQRLIAAGDHSLRSSIRGGAPYGFVIVGGPGQGKSTLGQILCQAYRVALLEDITQSITPRIDQAVASTRARLSQIGLDVPRNRRWPVFIDLSMLAEALSEKPDTTITEYVSSQLRSQNAPVKANQVASWLASWPWVLVLDGLDEVPARGSRIAVVEAVNDFIVQSRIENWDVMVVCTTRPQGYQNEFSELDPEKLELRLLEPREGLGLGKLITEARFEGDPESARRVVARLETASRLTHSSRLMRTPLQVSIMEFLLEEMDEVPNTRHELFDGYFRAIYAREAGKAGHLGKMLRTHAEHVEWVHEQIALRLQIQSEHTGESYASVSDGEIVDLFRQRLIDLEFDSGDIEQTARELDKATKERLVLLVPRTDGRISFEVRSLQEYMAARAIVGGDSIQVLARLSVLAPSAYWRNTWLLSVGRLYLQRPHERDALIERIRQLDTESLSGAFVGYGARLSIELLEDDFALPYPAHRRSLLSLALTQIGRWAGPELKRLSSLARSAMNGTDKLSAAMVSEVVAEGFVSGGRSRLGAVAILRDWEKDAGASGRFAQDRLHRDLTWRPATDADRASLRPSTSVGEVLDSVVTLTDLSSAEKELWDGSRAALIQLSIPGVLTAAEAIKVSRSDFDTQPAQDLIDVLSDSATRGVIMRLANATPISHAAAPIVLRRVLVAIDQSAPVEPSRLGL